MKQWPEDVEAMEAGASVAERLAFERLLADLSTTFANVASDRVIDEIEAGLIRLVEFLGFERRMMSNRGIYADGWYANTTPPVGPWVLNSPMPNVEDYKWELYDLTKDYSQANDLAAANPAKLKEMQALFATEAKKYEVYPLQNSSFARAIMPRPSATAGQTDFTYSGVMPGIAVGNSPNILNRSYTITADVTVPEGGGNGVIVTEGGRWGGFGLYLVDGKPVFDYNALMLAQFRWEAPQALAAGKHTIVFTFTTEGPGIAKGGTGVLSVDGQVAATPKIPHTIPFLMPADETFDVGLDTRTPVNDKDYQVPFAFTGTINKLNFKLGPVELAPPEAAKVQKGAAAASD